jgi:hypothetical protein
MVNQTLGEERLSWTTIGSEGSLLELWTAVAPSCRMSLDARECAASLSDVIIDLFFCELKTVDRGFRPAPSIFGTRSEV